MKNIEIREAIYSWFKSPEIQLSCTKNHREIDHLRAILWLGKVLRIQARKSQFPIA
jgi:hypothetical protein